MLGRMSLSYRLSRTRTGSDKHIEAEVILPWLVDVSMVPDSCR